MTDRGVSDAAPQTRPENSNLTNESSPGQPSQTFSHPPQPGIGMKPSTGAPNGALQAVQQVQDAAGQTVPHMFTTSVSYGESDPTVNPSTSNPVMDTQPIPYQIQNPLSQMLPNVPNRMLDIGNVACWGNPSYSQAPLLNSQPSEPLGMRQQNQLMGSGSISDSKGSTVGSMDPPTHILNNLELSALIQKPTQVNRKLLQTLESPNTPQQQQRGVESLKTNPSLMAALIQQRTARQQQQMLLRKGCMRASPYQTNQALQQLIRTLKSPETPQQQQQVLAILKANPQLLAACIEHRTAQQQMQQKERSMIAPPHQPIIMPQPQHQLLPMQRQQKPNQFPPPQPLMHALRSRMPLPMNFAHQQGYQNDNSQFQFQQQPQQILMQSQMKQMTSPTHPPVSPLRRILGQGHMPSPSQLMQQARSPPPSSVHLSQTAQSPQPSASPRTQANTSQIQTIPSAMRTLSSLPFSDPDSTS